VCLLVLNIWVTQGFAEILRDIQPKASQGELEIVLVSDDPIQNLKHTYVLSDGLPKIVLDLFGNWKTSKKNRRLNLESDIAERIRVGKHSDKLRVVVDLKDKASLSKIKTILSYTVRKTANGLVLNIKRTTSKQNKTDTYGVLRANDVLIPEKAGKIQSYFEGATEQPLIFIIGESHVSLKVQEDVVHILTYLRGAYDVKLVCTEGYDKLFPDLHKKGFIIAERIVAHSNFMKRRINAVEYIALTYPDVQVIGVENMSAYHAHGQILERGQREQEEKAKKWGDDFLRFMKEDLGTLRVSREKAKKLTNALKRFKNPQDFDALTGVLYDVTGRTSKAGKKLTSLLARREALSNPKSMTNIPEMKRRDRGMAANTLRVARERKADAVALVVGKLHLSGIEAGFKSKKVSYVSIIPLGVEEELKTGMSDDDLTIYNQWKKGEKTQFEKWLSQFKPVPKIVTDETRTSNLILSALVNANLMSRNGGNLEEIRQVTENAQIEGLTIENVYRVEGGTGIQFMVNGIGRAYIYFVDRPSRINDVEPSFRKIDEGNLDNRYYVIYEGGGGNRRPPIPPNGGGPTDGGGSSWNRWNRVYLAAIHQQRRENPEAVTIRLTERNNKEVYLQVDDQKGHFIGVSPEQLKELVKVFEESEGPGKILEASELAKIFADLSLPSDRTVLYQISQDDMIGNLSLAFIARLNGDNTFDHIREQYTVGWNGAQNDLDGIINPVPVANINNTIVLISDQLRNIPEYQDTLQSMQREGVTVNHIPSGEIQTVILLGSNSDSNNTWNATMADGREIRLDSNNLRNIIQSAENVVLFNSNVTNSDRVKRLYSNNLNIPDRDVLDLGRQLVEEIRESQGSIDSILRKIIDYANIRELLTTRLGNAIRRDIAFLGARTTQLAVKK